MLLTAAAALAFWWRLAVLGENLLNMDVNAQYHPTCVYAASALRQGTFPLWCPYSCFGIPFFASAQGTILYPGTLLFVALDFSRALSVFILLHFFLAGLFTYALLRHWDMARPAAFLGALAFMLGGNMVSMAGFLPLAGAIPWIPACVHAADRAFRSGGFPKCALCGLALAAQFLVGYPEVSVCTWMLLCLLCGFHCLRGVGGSAWSVARPVVLLGASFLVAAGLSAIYAIPLAELAWHSQRGAGIRYESASQCSLGVLPAIIGLLQPFYYGGPGEPGPYQFWLRCFYIGTGPLLLSVAGVICRTRTADEFWNRLFLVAAVLFFASLSMGPNTPVHRFFSETIPVLGFFRWPAKLSIFFSFPLALLAAAGFNFLGGDRMPGGVRIVGIAVVAADVGLFAIGALSAGLAFGPEEEALWLEIAQAAVFVNLAGGLAAAAGCGRFSLPALRASLIGLAALELFVLGKDINLTVAEDVYGYEPALASTIPPGARIHVSAEIGNTPFGAPDIGSYLRVKRHLALNTNICAHVMSTGGAYSLIPAWSDRYLWFVNQPGLPATVRQRLLAAAGVSREIVPGEFEGEALPIPDAAPRAYFATRARVVSDENEVLALLASGAFDWRDCVLLARPLAAVRSRAECLPLQVEHSVNSVRIDAGGEGGLLVLTDCYYPGWRASADGREIEIVRANFFQMAANVPGGTGEVVFSFQPRSFYAGAAVTCLSLLCTVCAVLLPLKFHRRERDSNPR